MTLRLNIAELARARDHIEQVSDWLQGSYPDDALSGSLYHLSLALKLAESALGQLEREATPEEVE